MEWNIRHGKTVIQCVIYPHVQVPNVGYIQCPGSTIFQTHNMHLTWLTRLLSCKREIIMEFLFADDPFIDLMNIFPFRFTAILFPCLWVLSALPWYIRLLSSQERSAVLAWMVLLSALRLCSVICTWSCRRLSYVDISFRIECWIDFCISVLCHVFRSCSTCVSRDMNAVCSPNILLILKSFLTLAK
jgi:hypothetical protein